MKYQDKLLTLIAAKTDIDAQALKPEVVKRFFEPMDNDEATKFIDDILHWRKDSAVFMSIVMGRLDDVIEEVVAEEESLVMDETQAERRADFDRTEARGVK